jgi:hypothetical protein
MQSKEKTKRESVLLDEYTDAIRYLNQFLPEKRRIRYLAWDMARAAKTGSRSSSTFSSSAGPEAGKGAEVLRTLEEISRECVEATGIFFSGRGGR